MATEPKPTRVYEGGPTRMFSTQRFQGGIPYSGGGLYGYAGLFICARCHSETPRVLFTQSVNDWCCRDCDSLARRNRTMTCVKSD